MLHATRPKNPLRAGGLDVFVYRYTNGVGWV